jgi:multidrug efflux pump subunit AcrB
VILFDPIFQGLAIALIGGSIASTMLTLLIVPLIYYMTESRRPARTAPTAEPASTH